MSDDAKTAQDDRLYCDPDDIVVGLGLYPMMGADERVGALAAAFRRRDGSTCSLVIPREVWDEMRLILAELDRLNWTVEDQAVPANQMN